MSTETLARREVEVALPDRHRLVAVGELHRIGDQEPYFSATADLLNLRRRGDNRIEACGCLHDEILEHAPVLAPVVLVHLADEHGRPMHALANAAYWAGLSTWDREGTRPMAPDGDYGRRHLETDDAGLVWAPETLASHLRITVEHAREVRAYVVADPNQAEAWRYIGRTLETRWQAEADAALAVLQAGT